MMGHRSIEPIQGYGVCRKTNLLFMGILGYLPVYFDKYKVW